VLVGELFSFVGLIFLLDSSTVSVEVQSRILNSVVSVIVLLQYTTPLDLTGLFFPARSSEI
jgi:hypothetical protein